MIEMKPECRRGLLPFPLLCALFCALAVSGCSYLRSKTVKETDPATGHAREVTVVRACSFFDSKGALTKFRNTTGGPISNAWVSGTSIGTLTQESTSTNLNEILSAVARGVAAGLK